MNKLNLINIRKDHITDVFNSIPNLKENASRANIAEHTGLSLMTIGKIIDAFIENGIVIQHKEAKDSPGRKAGLLAFIKNKVCRISDLTANEIIFMDLNLNVVNDTGDLFGDGIISIDNIAELIANSLDYKYHKYKNKIVYCVDTQFIFYDNKMITKSNNSDLNIVKEVINPDYIFSNSSEHAYMGMALKLRNLWFENFF